MKKSGSTMTLTKSTTTTKTFFNKSELSQFGISEKNESIEDVFNRTSIGIAQTETEFSNDIVSIKRFRKKIMNSLLAQEFIPSTTVLMNIGRFENAPLSACAVPPVDLQGDLKKIKSSVNSFHLNGMGTGFNFDDIENPLEIIEYLNQIGIDGQNNEKQLRPVGNMGTISIDHPKILEFIKLKKGDANKKWVFNFSINITESALEKIQEGEDIVLKNGQKITSNQFLETIADSIYETGDPGLVFIDRLNADNQVPSVGEYQSLAPCGEVGLSIGETCQFSYINLGKFTKNGEIDYQRLKEVITLVVRFLDNVVEYNIAKHQNETSQQVTRKKRKIGVGVCGFADLLNKLDLDYNSKKARNLAKNLFSFINYCSKQASVELAKIRGSFEAFPESMYLTDQSIIKKYANRPTDTVPKNQWRNLEERIKQNGIRNCSTIALPPTGRSSLLIGASQSIEPYFSEILDITPEEQLLMTASIQKFTDESISKTVNIARSTTKEQIMEIIKSSIDLTLKGITIYRDDSRVGQPTKITNN